MRWAFWRSPCSARYGSPLLSAAGLVMFAGIVLFSGSLYLLALTGTHWLGAVTPLGGVAFLASWAMVALAVPQPGLTPASSRRPCAGALHPSPPSYGARNRRDPLLPPMSSAPAYRPSLFRRRHRLMAGIFFLRSAMPTPVAGRQLSPAANPVPAGADRPAGGHRRWRYGWAAAASCPPCPAVWRGADRRPCPSLAWRCSARWG